MCTFELQIIREHKLFKVQTPLISLSAQRCVSPVSFPVDSLLPYYSVHRKGNWQNAPLWSGRTSKWWNAIMSKAKPSLKIGTANAICWNSLGLFRNYSLNHIFFRNKTFLFFKIEHWNFQLSILKNKKVLFLKKNMI